MHRRNFVRASVLGATTTGFASACSPPPQATNAPTSPEDEFLAHLDHLDRGMEDLRCRPIDLGRVARQAANEAVVCREDPLDEQLYRSSLRALLLTASVKDLREADRARPEVQARLDAHAAEVDFAVHGMTRRLTHMPAEELARVQDRLRSDPEMAQRIVDYIDDEARKSDFPLGRRLRLRRLARMALWRLRRQPAELVVQECTDKVQRLTARLTPVAVKQPFARSRPEDVAYWEAQTLRVVERYQDPSPAAAVADPWATVGQRRAAADQRRARAESMVASSPAHASAEFMVVGSLYEEAAASLAESDEQRAARSELLDLAIAAHLRAYELTPADPRPLRLALNTLYAHDAAYRTAYAERRMSLPEFVRLQAHTVHIQGLLLSMQPKVRPTVESSSAEDSSEARNDNARRLIRIGGIVVGVGVGLLALGLILGFTVTFAGFIIATIAGIALLVGIIVMIVGAAMKS
jgi:hypothetical protein